MIHHGDCLEVMAGMEPESVDAIVCDPPYGLGFMGKAWDHGAPGVPFWREMLRVAKPSAYLLAFGGTRTVHRIATSIEDAGWIIRDMLVWAYASGFPKSKASLKPAWEPIVMARKPGPLRMLAIDECRIPFVDGEEPDDREGEATEHTRYTLDGGTNLAAKPGRRIKSAAATMASMSGARNFRRVDAGSVTGLPTEPDGGYVLPAGRWPANVILTDPIFDGDVEGVVGGGAQDSPASYRRNVRPERFDDTSISLPVPEMVNAYGDSGTYSRFFLIPRRYNEPCARCGLVSTAGPPSSPPSPSAGSAPSRARTAASSASDTRTAAAPITSGIETTSWPDAGSSTTRTRRSPASRRDVRNLSNDPANNAARLETSSDTTTTTGDPWMCGSCVADVTHSFMDEREFAESRNYPWAFLIPKADRSDREPVLGGLPLQRGGSMAGGVDTRTGNPVQGPHRRNVHPTVKPTDLMRHLVRLVTPTGGLVLDPFLGSGTTAIAAELEGFPWIGIEKEAEYVAIAEARLNGTQRGLGLDVPAPTRYAGRPDSQIPPNNKRGRRPFDTNSDEPAA